MLLPTLKDLSLKSQRVLVREDLNVPLENGHIVSDARLLAALPTLKYALAQGAAVIVLSHLGRPSEGHITPELSLAPVAKRLQCLLGQPVRFLVDWVDGIELLPGELVLCENVRFQCGEKENHPALAKKIAALGDIFVMDAFATAHRREASTFGVAQHAQQAVAGFLLEREVAALSKVLQAPARPLLAIVGGSKVSTKLSVLSTLLDQVDALIVGGGIANTLLAAKGYSLGRSLVEHEALNEATELLSLAQKRQVQLLLPVDAIVANTAIPTAKTYCRRITEVREDERVLDIGPATIECCVQAIAASATILWNGPVGVFEMAPFAVGTGTIAKAIADSEAFSVAGGGDTLAAIEKFSVGEQISYISTGGGAFLAFIEGKSLPILMLLMARADKT